MFVLSFLCRRLLQGAVIIFLVPLLIFWVERRVAQKVRAENPELVAPSAV